jgi:hypothetical protein
MAKKEKFVFEELSPSLEIPSDTPINVSSVKNTQVQTLINSLSSNNAAGSKVTFDCPPDLLERLKDYGYWEGLSMRDIIVEALGSYFDGKNFKTRPDKVKNKKKVGRKPKSLSLIQQAMGKF